MAREYVGDEIAIDLESRLCIHAGECVRGMPEVFDANARPWITVENAFDRADELAEVIRRCPTGALHYRRLDGEAREPAEAPVRVRVQTDGPLYIRSALEITAPNGAMIRQDARTALCRCGDSPNKPFCDNSHIAAGFTAP
jgi:uncharacterized Fe-S cluster protein YjdI/CDGSH-type Zn-finger protein